MHIVCQRFTTSKLQAFEDLESIATYGFRGEALASISHIAHVTITSRTPKAPCAFMGRYADGAMVTAAGAPASKPTPCAGNTGTTVTVEDMFYNVPTRLRALRSASDEYRRILDVVQRYAVHAAARGAAFSCKKRGGAAADVLTLPDSTTKQAIGALYGAPIAGALMNVAITSDASQGSQDEAPVFTAKGLATQGTFSTKTFTLILFINHRLVSCPSIKRAIEAAYVEYLPKRRHPFVYLSLELPPATVDVNVHPTKREVHFLHEDAIVAALFDHFRGLLAGGNASRSFATQSALPFTGTALPGSTPADTSADTSSLSTATPVAPSHKVRVDSREQRLDDFFTQTAPDTQRGADQPARGAAGSHHTAHASGCGCASEGGGKYDFVATYVEASVNNTDPALAAAKAASPGRVGGSKRPPPAGHDSVVATRSAKRCRPAYMKAVELASVQALLKDIARDTHRELHAALRHHAFVGVVDAHHSLLQAGTKLLLVAHTTLAQEMFYQQAIRLFSNNISFALQPAPSVRRLLRRALADPTLVQAPAAPPASLAQQGEALLLQHAPMLAEYFGLHIGKPPGDEAADVVVLALPRLADGHTPEPRSLPGLLADLVWKVDWSEELPCLKGVATALGKAYAQLPPLRGVGSPAAVVRDPGQPQPPHKDSQQRDIRAVAEGDAQGEAARADPTGGCWVIGNVLFPAMRSGCCPSKAAAAAGSALQVACTEQLYRIFERC